MSRAAAPVAALEAVDDRWGFEFWRRFRQSRNARLGGVLVALVILVALGAPWLAPHRYQDTDLLAVWAEPSSDHVLGGDGLGRDVLSRLIVGARVSLFVAAIATVIGSLVADILYAVVDPRVRYS